MSMLSRILIIAPRADDGRTVETISAFICTGFILSPFFPTLRPSHRSSVWQSLALSHGLHSFPPPCSSSHYWKKTELSTLCLLLSFLTFSCLFSFYCILSKTKLSSSLKSFVTLLDNLLLSKYIFLIVFFFLNTTYRNNDVTFYIWFNPHLILWN